MSALKVGIVGAAGRGGSFKQAIEAIDSLRIHAVCDRNPEGLDRAAELMEASEQYLDFVSMLEESDVDAVIIGTPMPYHAPQANRSVRQVA